MKKLNIIITSAFCAAVMSVSASAASNECVPVYEGVNKINAIVNGVNISTCDAKTVIQALLENCLNGQLPDLPVFPDIDNRPEGDKPPIVPETPEQEEKPDNGESNGNISGSVSAFERQVVDLVNIERRKYGLQELSLSDKLSAVAREKSRDMQQNGYFSHTSPTYGSPFDMLRKFGIAYDTAGENIAMGYSTPQAVVSGWMNSAGHRANILNSSFTQRGVGMFDDQCF